MVWSGKRKYSTFAKSYISFQILYRLSNWRNAFGTSAANAVKTYIESNPDGMFTNKSDIAEFVQLYTEVQQTPPTVPFHWKVWEVRDDGKPMKKVRLSLSIQSAILRSSVFTGPISELAHNVYPRACPFRRVR